MAEGAPYLIGAVVMVFVVFVSTIIKSKKITFLNDASVAIVIGLIVGSILRAVGRDLDFDDRLFFNFLLPPIVFYAGFSLQRKNFFRNLSSILVFSYMGTLLTTVLVGLACFGLVKTGLVDISIFECFLFGAVISATGNPCQLLAVFNDLSAPQTLWNLMFGEAMLTDAVAVVVFSTLVGMAEQTSADFTVATGFQALGVFIAVSVGSALVGFVVALVGAAILRTKLLSVPRLELPFLLLIAYIAYQIAQIAYLSGSMSIFVCGIISAHYSLHNLTPESTVSSFRFFETLAYLCEVFVFTFLGVSVMERTAHWDVAFILLSMLFFIAARAFVVPVLAAFVNIRRKNQIGWKFQFVMWFAGLRRGAVAVALAFALPDDHDHPNLAHVRLVHAATLTIVIVTNLLMGSLTGPVLWVLKLKIDDEPIPPPTPGPPVQISGEKMWQERTGLHKRWKEFDERYMKKVFGGSIHPKQGLTTGGEERVDNRL